MQATSVDIGYDRAADRLRLVLHGEADKHGLWLTRRLAKAFLGKFAEMLARSAEAAAGRGADVGRAAAIFEHLDACGETSAPETEARTSGTRREGDPTRPEPPPSCAVITTVNVSPRRNGFVFTLSDEAEQTHELTLSRAEAHRLVSAIYRKSLAAEWDLAPHVGWLDEAEKARGHQPGAAAAH